MVRNAPRIYSITVTKKTNNSCDSTASSSLSIGEYMRARFNSVSVATILLLALSAGGCAEQKISETNETTIKEMDMSKYKTSKPKRVMRCLFIHHSCGGQWLAERGEANEMYPDTCLYTSHPNGGGLRSLLQRNNYEVHEAAYKSAIGEKTDVCDWNEKFRDRFSEILVCDGQDALYKDSSLKNDVVVFKSCFPNNEITSEGKEPGDPDSPVKSTANYKAAYTMLLGYFRKHPHTLFVCVTAPPLVQNVPSRAKEFMKNIIGAEDSVKAFGERARRFNNWLKDAEKGWLEGYELKNVVVFDYYDLLTRQGESNYLLYPTNSGNDSHPSAKGNYLATQKFIPFLNKTVNRFVGTR